MHAPRAFCTVGTGVESSVRMSVRRYGLACCIGTTAPCLDVVMARMLCDGSIHCRLRSTGRAGCNASACRFEIRPALLALTVAHATAVVPAPFDVVGFAIGGRVVDPSVTLNPTRSALLPVRAAVVPSSCLERPLAPGLLSGLASGVSIIITVLRSLRLLCMVPAYGHTVTADGLRVRALQTSRSS
jgi:hypothetical protein